MLFVVGVMLSVWQIYVAALWQRARQPTRDKSPSLPSAFNPPVGHPAPHPVTIDARLQINPPTFAFAYRSAAKNNRPTNTKSGPAIGFTIKASSCPWFDQIWATASIGQRIFWKIHTISSHPLWPTARNASIMNGSNCNDHDALAAEWNQVVNELNFGLFQLFYFAWASNFYSIFA